ncbi:hypothetical protein EVAR_34019_1 [Eumeta japonica]|uniref:Uncharacterized protein n=1 Tax=Eumeta variegata TaxID=151549 RepID=A0A4C1VR28_EUMVA|nr:hypothetical protein EVAR_34019_1 [Eumeta japonica]
MAIRADRGAAVVRAPRAPAPPQARCMHYFSRLDNYYRVRPVALSLGASLGTVVLDCSYERTECSYRIFEPARSFLKSKEKNVCSPARGPNASVRIGRPISAAKNNRAKTHQARIISHCGSK